MSKTTKCPDCGAEPGSLHDVGCDVERCPNCGGQALSCGVIAGCSGAVPEAERMPWTGTWPGDEDAIRLGLYCYWGPPWIPCDASHPGAKPDLNRLPLVGRWDRASRSWVKR